MQSRSRLLKLGVLAGAAVVSLAGVAAATGVLPDRKPAPPTGPTIVVAPSASAVTMPQDPTTTSVAAAAATVAVPATPADTSTTVATDAAAAAAPGGVRSAVSARCGEPRRLREPRRPGHPIRARSRQDRGRRRAVRLRQADCTSGVRAGRRGIDRARELRPRRIRPGSLQGQQRRRSRPRPRLTAAADVSPEVGAPRDSPREGPGGAGANGGRRPTCAVRCHSPTAIADEEGKVRPPICS